MPYALPAIGASMATASAAGQDDTAGGSRDGWPLFPPMGYGYCAPMPPEDLAALVAYLRTIEPVADAS